MTNEKFTPPPDVSWWKVTHSQSRVVGYAFAKTAYFAVQNVKYKNGNACGWVLSQCEVELMPPNFKS